MESSEFEGGISALKGKQIVIIGCGAQGLNQGLNMRDSGLKIKYALREGAIKQKRASYVNATTNNFEVGQYKELIPNDKFLFDFESDGNLTLGFFDLFVTASDLAVSISFSLCFLACSFWSLKYLFIQAGWGGTFWSEPACFIILTGITSTIGLSLSQNRIHW